MVSWLCIGWGLSVTNPATYISFLGIRITTGLFYYFSPAWWYFGLIVQLYLIFPFLWSVLQRFGATRLLIFTCLIAFPIRAIGLFLFTDYIDAWQRGAIFITRLPEFVIGISLAAWLYSSPMKIEKRLRSPLSLLLAFFIYGAGIILGLSLIGMTIAPFLLGIGAFLILYFLFTSKIFHLLSKNNFLEFVSKHSYALYLVHNPFIMVLVPLGLVSLTRVFLGITAAIIITVVITIFFEMAVGKATSFFLKWYQKLGLIRLGLWLFSIGLTTYTILLGCEVLIRQLDPQEILGWGERPSLTSDPILGWKLKPSQVTRLRWQSYDYQVTSNELGFPGPSYSQNKASDTYRILVTGDAFSSAEGVDTDQAWPRLLQSDLSEKTGQKIEVLNFAVTGYGPNQYVGVTSSYAPIYKPNLILIETFVNDFQDVLESNEQFQQSIGFNLPPQDSLRSIFSLANLRQYLRNDIFNPVKEVVTNKPDNQSYFLGNFLFLERDQPIVQGDGKQGIIQRFKEIKDLAASLDSQVVILMVPAPVQVCAPTDLAYYPRNVDLSDPAIFDLNQPQKVMQEITNSLGLPFYDLRSPLQSTSTCPYQRYNMHWTQAGHQLVADYISKFLLSDGYMK